MSPICMDQPGGESLPSLQPSSVKRECRCHFESTYSPFTSIYFAVHVTLNYSYSAAFVQTQLEMTVTPLHPRPLPHPPAEEDALKRDVTKSAKRHAISSRTLASDGRVVSQRTAVISFVHFPCLRDVTPAASFIQTNKYCLVWRELSHCLCRYESYSEAGRRENYKLQAFC